MGKNDASIMVKAEGLSKTYRLSNRNKVEALKDVNISIPQGNCVIIGGPSGSGKSTLLSLLGCLDRPSRGRIYYQGDDVTGFSEEELCRIRRAKVGFVFQQFHLLPRMSAWENASIGLLPLGAGEKERFLRACELLDRLGLHDRVLHRPEELSGGEQQRVSVARALINEPELILADEPTSNIDADSARKVLQVLAAMKEQGATIVMATHDVNLVQQTAADELKTDAIYRLSEGRI
jgi:putative ABC transport system ATP-binding protein